MNSRELRHYESTTGSIDPASRTRLAGADADWVNLRQTPQPLGIAPSRLRVRDPKFWGGGWPLTEIQTGHDAMVSAPEELVRLLLEIA